MRILTVIFYDDLHQLRIQALTLARQWKGKKAWTIVIENRDPIYQEEHFNWIQDNVVPIMTDWDLDIIRGESSYDGPGWIRQQIFKLYYSSIIEDDWVLVLDAKNFFIKSADEATFIRPQGPFKFVTGVDDQFHRDLLEEAKKIVGVTDDIPQMSAMTPWIWNTHDLRNMFDHINFSKDHWPYKKTTEFGIYWAWAYNKHTWVDYRPSISISGYWGNNTDEKYVKSQANLANQQNTVWVHHRYAYSELLRSLTAKVLERSGISKEDIKIWDKAYRQLLRHKADDIQIDNDQRTAQFK